MKIRYFLPEWESFSPKNALAKTQALASARSWNYYMILKVKFQKQILLAQIFQFIAQNWQKYKKHITTIQLGKHLNQWLFESCCSL